MDKTRILPPRVRGRVTGVLDFFVDEIRLFQNILLLTDNFDLVLQVQWWGEVLPVFIRPKKLHVEGKKSRKCHLLQSYYHSAQYEIKTTLDLFKTYLINCEVLELSVLDAFENYIIGSAFLKDLINVLYSNNEPLRLPIFDYLGEQIGEVIIHINFLQKPHQDKDVIQNKTTVMFENKSSDKKDSGVSSKIKSHSFTVAEKTIFYDSHSRKNLHEKVVITDAGFPISQFNFKKNESTSHSNVNLPVSDRRTKLCSSHEVLVNNKFKRGGKESTCLPEIQTENDASKVLYFGVTSERPRQKTDIKKGKITNKFNSNSIKCKSKHSEKLCVNSSDKMSRKSISKKAEGCKKLGKNSTKKEKELDFKESSTSSEPVKSEINQLYESTDLRNIPSKQSPNIKVLDYLFGSDMSKDDEESALNDFKKMSPSHNLVDSINELCLVSHKDSQKGINNSPAASLKQNLLNFDFNNPIERNYYERFFLKSNPDFEIAQLLNQPENSCMLGTFDGISNPKNKSPISSLKSVSKCSLTKRDTTEEADFLINISLPDRRSSCARCKYYKKLNELDAIIESLKHFEEKMLSHEKDLQSAFKENPDGLIKRDRF